MNEDRNLESDTESLLLTELEQVEGSTLPLVYTEPQDPVNNAERSKRHMGMIHVVLSKEILRVGSLIFYPGPQAGLVFNESRNSLSSASIHHTEVL